MIDRNPVVGRILVRDSIMTHGFCRKGGVITKISKSRVYFTLKGREDYRDVELYATNYVAVCDTPEEEAMLLALSDQNIQGVRNLERENMSKFLSVFSKDSK
jgi:hypothetical protein